MKRTPEQRLDMALGLVRQAALETQGLKALLVANDRADPRLNAILDVAVLLGHAEVALEDAQREIPETPRRNGRQETWTTEVSSPTRFVQKNGQFGRSFDLAGHICTLGETAQ